MQSCGSVEVSHRKIRVRLIMLNCVVFVLYIIAVTFFSSIFVPKIIIETILFHFR